MNKKALDMVRDAVRIWLAIATLACGISANAATYDWRAGVGVIRSDNIRRNDLDKQSETIADVSLKFDVDEHRPKLDVMAAGDLYYLDYLGGTYDNEVSGGLAGDLGFIISPDHFKWMVEDNYGQVKRNALIQETPSNRESFNFFRTGPELSIGTGRTKFDLGGRWAATQYDISASNTRRVLAHASLEESLSATWQANLRGTWERADYNDQTLQGYEIRTASVGVSARTAKRSTFAMDVGNSTVKLGDGGSSGGLLVRASFTLRISPRSALALTAGSEFADSAETFRLDQAQTGPSSNQAMISTTDTFKSDYAFLSWTLEGARTDFLIGGNWRRETHEAVPANDLSDVGARMSMTRRISPRTTLDLVATYDAQKYRISTAQYGAWTVGAGLSGRITSAVSWIIRLDEAGGSGNRTVADYDYHELRASLSLTYGRARKD